MTINKKNSKRVNSTLEITKKPYINYLRIMRTEREREEGTPTSSSRPKNYEWRNLAKTKKYDQHTKLDMIKMKSQYMDQIFKMKEKTLNYSNAPMENATELNNLLIDSIDAKLTVLDKLNL